MVFFSTFLLIVSHISIFNHVCVEKVNFLNRQSFTFLGKMHFVLEFCKISPRKSPGPKPSCHVVHSWRSHYYCLLLHFNAYPCLDQTFLDNLVTMGYPRVSKMTSKHFVEAGSTQCSRHPKTNEPKTIRNSTRASKHIIKIRLPICFSI